MGLNEHNFLRACHEPNFFGSRAELEPETYELQPSSSLDFTFSLKPSWAEPRSSLNLRLVQPSNVDHIHILFQKRLPNSMYVGFCQIGSRIFGMGDFFFKLFTIESFTNKDRLLKLVSIKKISNFQKWYCSKIRKFDHFETLKLRQKFNFQPFSTFNFLYLK